jgi:polyhydroxybutyrate depolymerase
MRAAPLVALLSLVASTLCAAQSVERTVIVGGGKRTYRLFAPPTASSAPAALVLAFHGGGGDGRSAELLTGLNAIARREGFVVAYPDGLDHQWNDGRTGAPAQSAIRDNNDDISFVRAVLTDIATVTPIDPKRVFATGISNGAIFSHYLAARLADRIAAIAPVAGGVAEPFNKSFAPSSPVSVLAINGTSDPLVPFAGGNVARAGRGRVVSADESVRLWVARDSTSSTPETGALADSDPNDGCRVHFQKWHGGKNGTEVWFYIEEGAGHTWPGGPQYAVRTLIGSVCRDIDASEAMWEFFKAHPKP